jgi:hypothetical protein
VDSRQHLILGKPFAVSFNSKGQAVEHPLKGPGQPLEGPLSYLYPPAPQNA